MKVKLFVVLALIVLLPLVAVGGLGWRLAWQEQEVVESRFRDALTERLRDMNGVIVRSVERHETELLRILYSGTYQTEALRELVRKSPYIHALFVLDAAGNRWHPPPDGALTDGEREFLDRSGQIWRDKQLFYAGSDGRGTSTAHGWYTWYWGNGANLLFWLRNPSGRVIGVDVDRSRLLADIVADLPDSDRSDPNVQLGRIALTGDDGAVAYQWGVYEPAPGEQPRVRLNLSAPLESRSLLYFTSAAQAGATGRGRAFGPFSLLVSMSALALSLIGLAAYFYRESTREMREAAVRVSFVNQVSHELKTPLTNIRMYAELLEQRLDADDHRSTHDLRVIVSESQRLSRLIGNVLTVARKRNDALAVHATAGSVDQCVQEVIDQFNAALAAKGVRVTFTRGAGASVEVDRDALAQMLGNLFSNVEKYAAGGGLMEIVTRQDGATTTVVVADRGPGIPRGQEERIFDAFHRLSNRVSDGVTGTGIGLTIARDLARQHGGDLKAVASEQGARFELQLRTPPVDAVPAPVVEERHA